MTERTERNPISQEVRMHIRAIAQRGAVGMDDANHALIHGTSKKTLMELLQSGVIIGNTHPIGKGRASGNIFVYPTNTFPRENQWFSENGVEELLARKNDALDDTKGYAELIAERHAFLGHLAIPITDVPARNAARDILSFFYEEGLIKNSEEGQYFLDRGISEARIYAALMEATKNKGFLLGIGPQILTAAGISLHDADEGGGDIQIDTQGKGLPYRFISGIQPLGPREEAFLRELIY